LRSCSHCDTRNAEDAGYCRSCGQPLATIAGEEAVAGAAGGQGSGRGGWEESMQELAGPASAAGEAEGPRRRLLEANSCPHCGTEVPGGYAFCPGCGEDVRSHDATGGETGETGDRRAADEAAGVAFRDASLVRIVEEGEIAGSYPLEHGQTIIGREEGDLRFPTDVFLSNPHARLFFDEGRLYVEDLDSVNGVFVRVEEPQPLREGDVFLLGRQLLRLDPSPFATPDDRGPTRGPLGTLEESPDEEVEEASVDLPEGTARYGFPPQEVVGCLTSLLSDGRPGSRFLLDGREVTLGRERGDIVFTRDHYMSNEHAALRRDDGSFVLEDLGSRNGTFLGVRRPTEVGDGTALLIGRQLFRIRLE